MTKLKLVLNGTYISRCDEIITIIKMNDSHDAATHPFLGDNGDTFTEDGVFDLVEETACDLIKPRQNNYLILYGYLNEKAMIVADDPIHAEQKFEESVKGSGLTKDDINHVYELKEVTPEDNEELKDGPG